MAGWSIFWSRRGPWADRPKVGRALQAAAQGAKVDEHWVSDQLAIGTWRRESGEFPVSGVLRRVGDQQVAWVGQLLDDRGDATTVGLERLPQISDDDAALAGLNGPFAAALVDATHRTLRIVQDRFGHYPLYCHDGAEGTLVIATDVRALLPFLPQRRIDIDSLRMMLRCGELIEDRSLVDGVRMLLGGTVTQFDADGRRSSRRYWRIRHQDGKEGRIASPGELGERLRQGVRRMERSNESAVITLSGGLDSRLILDLTEHPERVPSFTWGLPGCRDITCASEFAQLVQSPHTVRHWEPQAFPPLWAQGVGLTAGTVGIDSMFMLPYTKLLGSRGNFVYNGLAGDVILGGNFVRQSVINAPDLTSLAQDIWRWRASDRDVALADRLLAEQPGSPASAQRWVDSIRSEAGAAPMARVCDWLVENRIFRTTNCGTQLLRADVESHSPFFDNDFFDALMTVPLRERMHHKLYLETMRSVAPRAGKARWQRTGIRPDLGLTAQLAARGFHAIANRIGAKLGFDPFPGLKVADVPGWMRGPWQAPLESLLFDPAFLADVPLDAKVLREAWNGHLLGRMATRALSVTAVAAQMHRVLREAS